MVNVFDVAERANVSSATVSRVLSGSPLVRAETKARVIAAAQALGYQPNAFARSLRMGRGSSVALVTGDIEHGIYPRLAKHLQHELELIGLGLMLFNLGHQQERLRHMLEHAAAMGLRGLFLASADVADMETLQPLVQRAKTRGIAILSVSQRLEHHGIDSIVHDDRAGAAMAVGTARARPQGDRLSRPHRVIGGRQRARRRLRPGPSPGRARRRPRSRLGCARGLSRRGRLPHDEPGTQPWRALRRHRGGE